MFSYLLLLMFFEKTTDALHFINVVTFHCYTQITSMDDSGFLIQLWSVFGLEDMKSQKFFQIPSLIFNWLQ